MPHPAAGKTTQTLVPLAKGSYALVALNAIHEGDAASVPKQEREMLRAQMAQALGQQDVEGLLAALRSHAKIEIAKNRLQ